MIQLISSLSPSLHIQINIIQSTNRSIDSGRILQRPDLGLLYYPPLVDLYWFISRTVFLLNNNNIDIHSKQQYPVLKQIRDILTDTMRTNGSSQLIGLGECDEDGCYWDGFIGQGNYHIQDNT